MKKTTLLCAALLASGLMGATVAAAYELEQGLYAAGVIDFPTALNQPTTHTFHGSLELTDISKPVLNLYNFRYGFQTGAFQLLSDFNWSVAPIKEFDYGQVRAKLQVLALDEYRSYLAVGLMGRVVANAADRPTRIDDRTASLFIIETIELYPFDSWGGFLFNFYLDNRHFNFGLKGQIYQSIQGVAEVDVRHSTTNPDKVHGRGGVSFENLQNFYFQILYLDVGSHAVVQVGTGF